VKTAKDLKIPFTWEERRPILLDRFFYIPAQFEYQVESVPFFSDNKPVAIEYCSGNGEWIGERAKENPEFNWLAVEKKFERARQVWLKSHRENITNLTVVCGEGLIFTRYYAPPTFQIYVNFPDPWPKLRHAKHRIIQERFLSALLRIVEKGGKATCVTDDAAYAVEMKNEFSKCPDWKFLFHLNEWPDYGSSFFKNLWKAKGRIINYLSYEKQ
jgi:tRNA (guanine-N7-)-methyltransferase